MPRAGRPGGVARTDSTAHPRGRAMLRHGSAGGTGRPPSLSARPLVRPHATTSAAVALRRRLDRDLILHAVEQLVADALHLPEIVRTPERLLAPVIDDRLRLRRSDARQRSEL